MSPRPPIRAIVATTMASLLGSFADSAAAADVPSFSQLPVGRMSAPPAKTPYSIGPGEKVAGLFVVQQSFGMPGQPRPVTIAASEATAKSLRGLSEPDEDEAPPCVLDSGSMRSFGFDDEENKDWQGNFQPVTSLWPRGPQNLEGGVRAVHSEKIVDQGAGASLEWVDAWVDPATRRARLIAKASLPLKLVETTMGGLRVYAARDERPDGQRRVQFVVRPVPGHRSSAGLTSVTPLGRFSTSSCGHVRVSLPLDGAKTAESATVITSVRLPQLEAAPPPKSDTDPANVAFAGVPGFRVEEVRVRELRVHVSVSQTSRDREPVVAVSTGWFGREHVENAMTRSRK